MVTFLVIFWNTVGGFSYDFYQASQGEVECKVIFKIFSFPATRKGNGFLGIVEHVL